MKFKKTYRFALWCSLIITLLLVIMLFIVSTMLNERIGVNVILITTFSLFIFAFIFIQIRVEVFIYNRVKKIYDDVLNNDVYFKALLGMLVFIILIIVIYTSRHPENVRMILKPWFNITQTCPTKYLYVGCCDLRPAFDEGHRLGRRLGGETGPKKMRTQHTECDAVIPDAFMKI